MSKGKLKLVMLKTNETSNNNNTVTVMLQSSESG